MYKLSQWAGDFPMLSEPRGSFTPLFTSQPEELAFSKSVSLRLHISASCPVFLFSLCCFFFFLKPPPPPPLPNARPTSSLLNSRLCRLVAPPFSAGPPAALPGRTHGQELSRCWWIKLFYNHDWPCQATDWRTAQWEWRWWKESSWQYSQVPAALYTLTGTLFLLFLFDSHLLWLTVIDLFFCFFFFLLPPFWTKISQTVHWQILYKIAI